MNSQVRSNDRAGGENKPIQSPIVSSSDLLSIYPSIYSQTVHPARTYRYSYSNICMTNPLRFPSKMKYNFCFRAVSHYLTKFCLYLQTFLPENLHPNYRPREPWFQWLQFLYFHWWQWDTFTVNFLILNRKFSLAFIIYDPFESFSASIMAFPCGVLCPYFL